MTPAPAPVIRAAVLPVVLPRVAHVVPPPAGAAPVVRVTPVPPAVGLAGVTLAVVLGVVGVRVPGPWVGVVPAVSREPAVWVVLGVHGPLGLLPPVIIREPGNASEV